MDVNIGGTFSGFPRILSVPAAIEDTTDLYRLARTSHPWGRAKKLDVCFFMFSLSVTFSNSIHCANAMKAVEHGNLNIGEGL